jgi:MoaA/NifB/PqqE/SkfB family radical SAM enzyme
MQEARPEPLPRARRVELVAEFARLNPAGTVVLPGGEVTLDWEELEAVAGACRDAGLGLFVLTNGSRIQEAEAARRLATSGVTHVAVSLDGPTAELHDYTRGVPTAFAETTRAIRLLAEARDAVAPGFVVQTACVLFKESLPVFEDYLGLCRSLGAQHVDFQMLARTFANRHPSRDVFFEKHFWHTAEEKRDAKRRLTELLEAHAGDPFLVKQPADLPWILDYVDDPDFRTAVPVCGSHQRNLHVDAQGNVALCFNTAAILDAPFVGSARETALAELWSGPKAAADRAVMDLCTLNCGALNCHRRKVPAA